MMDQVSALSDVGLLSIEHSTSSDSLVPHGFVQEIDAHPMAVFSAHSAMPTSLEPSSTKVTEDVAANSSDSPAKPKLEDFLPEFELPQAVPIIPGRRPYRPKERKKVERVRKVGACLRCRILKIPCRVELPCKSCGKLCDSQALGKTLCVRQKLLAVRQEYDLWNHQNNMEWIRDEITLPLHGPKKYFQLSLVNACDISSPYFDESGRISVSAHEDPHIPTVALEIEVQEFYPSPGREKFHDLIISDENASVITIEKSYYAITPDSLPTLDDLERWSFESARSRSIVLFVNKLQGSFIALARRYCECKTVLPLADLMRKAARLSCLHGIWCSALPQQRRTSQEPTRYVSKAVHQQIGVIVSDRIEAFEYDILNQIEELIFHRKGPGKENMLPIWTCLWLLMLTYRRTVLHGMSENWGNEAVGLAQHMYEMLISIYSALFKPSSPLWLNFLKDEVFELFGRDVRIAVGLGTIKTEMGYMQNDHKDFQSNIDVLLRSLILEHEKKLGRKAHEKAQAEAMRMNGRGGG